MSVTETKYKVSTATHSIDFSKSDEVTYARFSALCEGRDIGVLGTCFGEET
jgi:17beta-estradiol 17-dehydrogenase / very-long-chain 3-oxoacyl-CoA reductase